jgi:phospholipid transport system substrate-binding protein
MTLGPNWRKLDNSQQGEFVELYRQLLQGVYLRQLLTYTDEKIVFVRETMLTDTKAEVVSTLISSSKQIPINYRLVFRNGEWRVYDLVIEGVSLVSNYRNQFNDLLNKQSPADMLMTLRKKVTEEKNQT